MAGPGFVDIHGLEGLWWGGRKRRSVLPPADGVVDLRAMAAWLVEDARRRRIALELEAVVLALLLEDDD